MFDNRMSLWPSKAAETHRKLTLSFLQTATLSSTFETMVTSNVVWDIELDIKKNFKTTVLVIVLVCVWSCNLPNGSLGLVLRLWRSFCSYSSDLGFVISFSILFLFVKLRCCLQNSLLSLGRCGGSWRDGESCVSGADCRRKIKQQSHGTSKRRSGSISPYSSSTSSRILDCKPRGLVFLFVLDVEQFFSDAERGLLLRCTLSAVVLQEPGVVWLQKSPPSSSRHLTLILVKTSLKVSENNSHLL